jgi:hypothetical protein
MPQMSMTRAGRDGEAGCYGELTAWASRGVLFSRRRSARVRGPGGASVALRWVGREVLRRCAALISGHQHASCALPTRMTPWPTRWALQIMGETFGDMVEQQADAACHAQILVHREPDFELEPHDIGEYADQRGIP